MVGDAIADLGVVQLTDVGIGAPRVSTLRLLTDGAEQTVWATWRNWKNEPVGDSFQLVIPSATDATAYADLGDIPKTAVALKIHKPARAVWYEYWPNGDARLAHGLATPARMQWAQAHIEWIAFGRWGA